MDTKRKNSIQEIEAKIKDKNNQNRIKDEIENINTTFNNDTFFGSKSNFQHTYNYEYEAKKDDDYFYNHQYTYNYEPKKNHDYFYQQEYTDYTSNKTYDFNKKNSRINQIIIMILYLAPILAGIIYSFYQNN